MHIVLLNDDVIPTARGGAAVVVNRLRQAYARAGHDVTLITTHQEHERWEEESDEMGRIIRLPIRASLRDRHRLCANNPAAALHVRNALRKLKPDAVHAHNLHAYLTYESLLLAREHTHRIILTAHDTFLVSFGRVQANRRLTILDHLAAAGRNYAPFRNRRIRATLQKSGTMVIAISNVLASFLQKNGIAVHAVIYNGTEISPKPELAATDRFRKTHGLQGPTILFGGRIGADKGTEVLRKAFIIVRSEIPSVQLAIAGDRERIENSVKGTQGIVLLGHLQQAEMPLAYAAASLVTTPSIYLDPFNLMNIEAMAAGKAVVGTTFGGTPEIVVDGETGFLVDPHNIEHFARMLLALLRDPQRAHHMGEQGRKRVSEHFSLEKQAKAYLSLFPTARHGADTLSVGSAALPSSEVG